MTTLIHYDDPVTSGQQRFRRWHHLVRAPGQAMEQDDRVTRPAMKAGQGYAVATNFHPVHAVH